MTKSVTVAAPCKVNLTLDVFPRRPDGYHDLDSLVVTFAPWDTLTVGYLHGNSPSDRSIALTCDDASLPTDERNLAYRAAKTFLDEFLPNQAIGITIDLLKRLPSEAGLGGGSSDAAAVLRGLARLFAGNDTAAWPPIADLLRVAARIGSDVPLFLCAGPVRMRGRGEIVETFPVPMPPLTGVFVKPEGGVPTGAAYSLLDARMSRDSARATPRLLDVLTAGGDTDAIGAAMHNDFEAVVLPAFPNVAAAYGAVSDAGAVRCLLCGSGSTVFGLARGTAQARAMASTLKKRFPWVRVGESRATSDTITSDVD